MAGRTRRRWLVAGACAITLVASIALILDQWRREGLLWQVIMTEKIPDEGVSFEGEVRPVDGGFRGEIEHPLSGFRRVLSRGPNEGMAHGWSELRFDENGLLALARFYRKGEEVRMVVWNFDGTLEMQRDTDPESCRMIGLNVDDVSPGDLRRGDLVSASSDALIRGEDIFLPPWKWGVTDQGDSKHGWEIEKREDRKIAETHWHRGKALSKTVWNLEGQVHEQIRFQYDGDQLLGIVSRLEPPWWPVSDAE